MIEYMTPDETPLTHFSMVRCPHCGTYQERTTMQAKSGTCWQCEKVFRYTDILHGKEFGIRDVDMINKMLREQY